MPRFRLSSLFIVVAITAVSLAALLRPSVYWSVAMPATMTVLCVFGVHRAIVSAHERAMWTSFIGGLAAYFLGVVFIRPFFMYDGKWDVWQMYFGAPVWKLLHGAVPRTSTINGNSLFEFISFLLSLHFICALLVSGFSAYIAQTVSNKQSK
jgi:hypothetical protein